MAAHRLDWGDAELPTMMAGLSALIVQRGRLRAIRALPGLIATAILAWALA